jgi:hypothetical protein
MRRRPARRGGRGGIRDRAETGDAERSFFLSAEEREAEHPSSFSRFRGTCCKDCDDRDNRGGTRRSSSVNDERLSRAPRCYRKSVCVGIIV